MKSILNFLKNHSIKTKLLLLMLIVAFLPMLIMGGSSILISGNILEEQTASLSIETLKQISQRIEKELKNIDDLTLKIILNEKVTQYLELNEEMVTRSQISSAKKKVQDYILQTTANSTDVFSGFQIYSKNNTWPINIGYTMKISPNYQEAAWYQDLTQYKQRIVFKGITNEGNQSFIPIYRLIIKRGSIVGVLRAALNPEYISEIFKTINFGAKSELMIANQKGLIIAHQEEAKNNSQLNEVIRKSLSQTNKRVITINNHKQLLSIFPVLEKSKEISNFDSNWYIVASIAHDFIVSGTKKIAFLVIMIILICILLAFFLGFLFAKGILEPINRLMLTSEKVAQGDLNVKIDLSAKDEIGKLSLAFAHMVQNLKQLILESQEAINIVLQASQDIISTTEVTGKNFAEISYSIEDIANGAHQSSLKAEHGMRMMFKLSEEIKSLSLMIMTANQESQDSLQYSRQSTTTIHGLIKSSNEVTKINQTITENIYNLAATTEEIQKTTVIIMDFAEQTGLLALNAAIEAAHNNQMGKGFEIVAAEIQKLANRSDEAARLINKIVKTILENIHLTVHNFKKAQAIMQQEKIAINENIDLLQNISNGINQISSKISLINNSINNIYEFGDETKKGIEDIAAVVEETGAAVEEVNAASEENRSCVDTLTNYTHQFNNVASELQKTTSKFLISKT